MKILIVHNDYQQAGGERAAVRVQIELLRRRGHTVVVFWRDNAAISGFSSLDKAAFFPQAIYNSAISREIGDLARREQFDIAHVHNVFPLISPAVYRALHQAGVPIVQTIHNFRLMCPNGLFYTHGQICERCKRGNMLPAIQLRCYRESTALSALYAGAIMIHRRVGTFGLIDRVLALTDFVAGKLAESGVIPSERIAVLGNALGEDVPAPPASRATEPALVFMGRLVPEKGVDLAIEAMAGLPDLELRICGDGPDLPRLREVVAARGLTNVRFLGFVDGAQKRQVLERALAIVVPSHWYELFPITALEAMAYGVPVLATGHGSLQSLIADGQTGLLFRPGDAASFAECARRLSSDPALAAAMGARAAAEARTRYSADVHYQALLGQYALAQAHAGSRPTAGTRI
jgi:glycosyltransferase involved in cell wall biosynthesis